MQFNSLHDILFFPLVALGYFAASTAMAMGLALGRVERPAARAAVLLCSLALNLGLLFTFKYVNFFSDSLAFLAGVIGNREVLPYHLDVLLPAGISFYTFQTLAHTIDVYRRDCPAEKHLGRFALYVALSPSLWRGPSSARRICCPSSASDTTGTTRARCRGCGWYCGGLFKKMVVADRMALIAGSVYGEAEAPAGIFVVIGIVAFAFQIYCDFSAYSDIAVGSARVLGIDLMLTSVWFVWHVFSSGPHRWSTRWTS